MDFPEFEERKWERWRFRPTINSSIFFINSTDRCYILASGEYWIEAATMHILTGPPVWVSIFALECNLNLDLVRSRSFISVSYQFSKLISNGKYAHALYPCRVGLLNINLSRGMLFKITMCGTDTTKIEKQHALPVMILLHSCRFREQTSLIRAIQHRVILSGKADMLAI